MPRDPGLFGRQTIADDASRPAVRPAVLIVVRPVRIPDDHTDGHTADAPIIAAEW